MLFTLQRYEFFSKSQQLPLLLLLRKGCCLPYKGTNFSANHNGALRALFFISMLFTLQRYEFFSKSQRCSPVSQSWGRCCLPYKGTNFSANHNGCAWFMFMGTDVVYPTKVRIFQQITTHDCVIDLISEMLFTLQRYEFFSKSQPMISGGFADGGCCLPNKGTNFSANHNRWIHRQYRGIDVVYPTKVRIFQQITTCHAHYDILYGCCLPYKGTNFSANHNCLRIVAVSMIDVVYPTKVRIFQQITTLSIVYCFSVWMLFTLQRYEFFSKSQLNCFRLILVFWCCLPYKGTNFSANHNISLAFKFFKQDVVYPTKVRIFQQITTIVNIRFWVLVMLFTLQRYEFFSKSQRGWQHFILSPVISKFKPNNFS